uniref:Uncharacterized protein n=1 Tax=Micrurus paraensis TaxID=1970185 RepID=A0A2D4KUW0_9SAUR
MLFISESKFIIEKSISDSQALEESSGRYKYDYAIKANVFRKDKSIPCLFQNPNLAMEESSLSPSMALTNPQAFFLSLRTGFKKNGKACPQKLCSGTKIESVQ